MSRCTKATDGCIFTLRNRQYQGFIHDEEELFVAEMFLDSDEELTGRYSAVDLELPSLTSS